MSSNHERPRRFTARPRLSWRCGWRGNRRRRHTASPGSSSARRRMGPCWAWRRRWMVSWRARRRTSPFHARRHRNLGARCATRPQSCPEPPRRRTVTRRPSPLAFPPISSRSSPPSKPRRAVCSACVPSPRWRSMSPPAGASARSVSGSAAWWLAGRRITTRRWWRRLIAGAFPRPAGRPTTSRTGAPLPGWCNPQRRRCRAWLAWRGPAQQVDPAPKLRAVRSRGRTERWVRVTCSPYVAA
mmetsp:Transcript_14452/g.46230  ORF Transcript_14452/g.46230 Transcript_14452/m.46230 type:complete len:242 (+) Transcript_14452:610-1335(+)